MIKVRIRREIDFNINHPLMIKQILYYYVKVGFSIVTS